MKQDWYYKQFDNPIEQPQEVLDLLAAPLTESDEIKIWPETGVRGFNCQPIATIAQNKENPGMYLTHKNFRRLKEFGVNSLRLMIRPDEDCLWNGSDYKKKKNFLPPVPKDDPMAPYHKHLEAMKVALQLAEQYDMYIIPSGDGVVGRGIDIYYKESDGSGYAQAYFDLWMEIVKRYGKHPRLLAYDLMNEPYTDEEKTEYIDVILPKLIKLIREKDQNTYLIVEPHPFSLPESFSNMLPINDPKMVYSPHWYYPHSYTHQGLGGYPEVCANYPGMLRNFNDSPLENWDKERLRKAMQPVRDFQLKYNAKIWIGEFSVIRWASGAANWLDDSISLFEEYGWDWACHAYRGWSLWNPTFRPYVAFTSEDDGGFESDRLKVLMKWFSLNGKERNSLQD